MNVRDVTAAIFLVALAFLLLGTIVLFTLVVSVLP